MAIVASVQARQRGVPERSFERPDTIGRGGDGPISWVGDPQLDSDEYRPNSEGRIETDTCEERAIGCRSATGDHE
jgi:hypothetical protein